MRSNRYISLVIPKANTSFGCLSFQFPAANDWKKKNRGSWRLISPSLTLNISCQSSSQIIAPVHSPSVNSPSNYLITIAHNLILPHLHTLYIHFFYCVIDCTFVNFMCYSVLLFVSHCFALSWRGRSCKWEVVLNWTTRLNTYSYTHLTLPTNRDV